MLNLRAKNTTIWRVINFRAKIFGKSAKILVSRQIKDLAAHNWPAWLPQN